MFTTQKSKKSKKPPKSAFELAQRFDEITFTKSDAEYTPHIGQLYTAVTECLSEAEACKLFALVDYEKISLSHTMSGKIAKDIERRVLPCHTKLAKTLLAKFPTANPKKAEAFVKVIGPLLDRMPDSFRVPILENLLHSKLKYLQLLAFKFLQQNWSPKLTPTITDLWRMAPNQILAQLISESFPVQFLIEQFGEIQDQLINLPISLARLYKRIGEVSLKKLRSLPKADEIRYLYVLVKLGKALDKKEAMKIFERNKYSDDLGLLIWSLGKMKQWYVLQYVCQEIEQIWLDRISLITKAQQVSTPN